MFVLSDTIKFKMESNAKEIQAESEAEKELRTLREDARIMKAKLEKLETTIEKQKKDKLTPSAKVVIKKRVRSS